jgi:L-2,4-diaminobutyric acid acetyltransferase
LLPERTDTLFVWQVVVAAEARGEGLGKQLLKALLGCEACQGVRFLETTITKSNQASRALFKSIADGLEAECEESVFFDREEHFMGSHDTEHLIRIGPFTYQK